MKDLAKRLHVDKVAVSFAVVTQIYHSVSTQHMSMKVAPISEYPLKVDGAI